VEEVRWASSTKEEPMKKEVGLWMDHRKAVIVVVTDKGEEIRLIVSKVRQRFLT
jgi:hypothetical protein